MKNIYVVLAILSVWCVSALNKMSTEVNLLVDEPVLPVLSNILMCDNDNDGFATFDITVQNASVLAAQTGVASTYQITYHENQNDAQIGGSGLSNPSSYFNIQPFTQSVYVRIRNVNTDVFVVGSFSLIVNSSPFASGPQSYASCDYHNDPYDGVSAVNLTQFASAILAWQNPSFFSVTYYASMSGADSGIGPIIQATNYIATNGQVIWVRVQNNATGCYAITSIAIVIEPLPNPIITTLNNVNTICVDYHTDIMVRALTLNSGIPNSSSFSFQWYENGTIITNNSSTYTVNTPSLTGTTRDYSVAVTSNSALGCRTVSASFSVVQSGQATPSVNSLGYQVFDLSGVHSIIVNGIIGYGIYEYSLDNHPRQASTIFNNVSIGNHVITVWDTEGGTNYSCDPLVINNVAALTSPIPAPTGVNAQTLAAGATLANIAVVGSNIQWYASPYANAIPIPQNTEVLSGTTYYASQTVGGVQSTARLAVTVQINLGIVDTTILNLTYAPNPVKDILNIESNSILQSVSVYNLIGQKMYEQSNNTTHAIVDLSNLPIGNYIVKIQGEQSRKTIRIVKE